MFLNPEKVLTQIPEKFIKIADFGSGLGHFAKNLPLIAFDEGEIYLFDIDGEKLKRAKNDLESEGYDLDKFHFLEVDLEEKNATGLKDNFFDFILISQLLFQVKNPENILKEAKRVLSDNGNIFLIEWKDSFNGIGPDKKHLLDEKKMKKILEKENLEIFKELDAGKYHYAYLLKVKKK